jgi:hypothetical protein
MGLFGTPDNANERIDKLERCVAAANDAIARLHRLLDEQKAEIKVLAAKLGSQPTVEFVPQGNIANRMIQFMVMLSITDLVPGCQISGAVLPEWDISHPKLPIGELPVQRFTGQKVDVDGIAAALRSGLIGRAIFEGWGQHISNFLPPERYRRLFYAPSNIGQRFGPEYLVISIRGAEVLQAPHPSYVLIPVAFYQEIVERTGLRPVFMGQLTPSPYLDELRAAFPNSVYLDSQGAIEDFQTIRKATNVVLSVSTFSWLAAWLSDAEQIFMPLSGLLNPMQSTDVDLAPLNDPRYRFFLFPINYAAPVERYNQVHKPLLGRWKEISASELMRIRDERPTRPRIFEEYLKHLDSAFYLRRYYDVSDHVEAGIFQSGIDHYTRAGFAENREILELDPWHYSTAYPDAAEAVADGEYADFQHHFVHIGQTLGYQPVAGQRLSA